MIAVDTSSLVRSLCGPRTALPRLQELIEAGNRLRLPALVLYEWRRGPRSPQELTIQEQLFPTEQCLEFGAGAATLAAELFAALGRPRRRGADIAIAATALEAGASLWTMNSADFEDIPGLTLVD